MAENNTHTTDWCNTNTTSYGRRFQVPSRALLEATPAEIYRAYGAEVAEAIVELRATVEIYRQMWVLLRDNRP